jgi:hypothetical protein
LEDIATLRNGGAYFVGIAIALAAVAGTPLQKTKHASVFAGGVPYHDAFGKSR